MMRTQRGQPLPPPPCGGARQHVVGRSRYERRVERSPPRWVRVLHIHLSQYPTRPTPPPSQYPRRGVF
eukprot:5600857-Pyramimonas_sp.AAC.2